MRRKQLLYAELRKTFDPQHIWAVFAGASACSLSAIPRLATGIDVYGHPIPIVTEIAFAQLIVSLFLLTITTYLGSRFSR